MGNLSNLVFNSPYFKKHLQWVIHGPIEILENNVIYYIHLSIIYFSNKAHLSVKYIHTSFIMLKDDDVVMCYVQIKFG